jgi:hypothetical protein
MRRCSNMQPKYYTRTPRTYVEQSLHIPRDVNLKCFFGELDFGKMVATHGCAHVCKQKHDILEVSNGCKVVSLIFFNWGFRIKHFQNQKNACLPKTNVFTCFICFATMVERLFRECDSQVDKSTFLACLLCDSCNLEIKSPSGTWFVQHRSVGVALW